MPSSFVCLCVERDIVLIVCEIACFPFVKWDVCACSGLMSVCGAGYIFVYETGYFFVCV